MAGDRPADAIDLDAWTPAGRRTVDYAVELLNSTHPPEVRGTETWLLAHPAGATPALVAALATPAAQPAVVLLGALGHPDSIERATRRGASARRGGPAGCGRTGPGAAPVSRGGGRAPRAR